jgi:hypothetical protein
MAIRRWAARPDQVSGDDGEPIHIPVVSREAMREAFLDGEALMAQAGGVFTAVSERVRTNVPQEMVTTYAAFEWKDRTDARPQPEPEAGRVAATPAPALHDDGDLEDAPLLEDVAASVEERADQLRAEAQALDKEAAELVAAARNTQPAEAEEEAEPEQPEEDLSAIPAHLRSAV